MNEKILLNTMISDRLYRLSLDEKQEVVQELLKTRTERQLAEEIGVPRTTIHDWKTKRQRNLGKDIHISFSAFYRKILNTNPEEITDWGRLKMIKERIEYLLMQNEK